MTKLKITFLLLLSLSQIYCIAQTSKNPSDTTTKRKRLKQSDIPHGERYFISSSAFMPRKKQWQYFNNYALFHHFEYTPHQNISLQTGFVLPITGIGIPTSIKIGKNISPKFAIAAELRNLWGDETTTEGQNWTIIEAKMSYGSNKNHLTLGITKTNAFLLSDDNEMLSFITFAGYLTLKPNFALVSESYFIPVLLEEEDVLGVYSVGLRFYGRSFHFDFGVGIIPFTNREEFIDDTGSTFSPAIQGGPYFGFGWVIK